MKKLSILLFAFVFVTGCNFSAKKEDAKQKKIVESTFKGIFKDKFYVGAAMNKSQIMGVITSYSIHYTKLYESIGKCRFKMGNNCKYGSWIRLCVITSYSIHYTKLYDGRSSHWD